MEVLHPPSLRFCLTFSIWIYLLRNHGGNIIIPYTESEDLSRKELTIFSWRAEEAAFAIVVAIVSSEDSDEYDGFLKQFRPKLVNAMRSPSILFPSCSVTNEIPLLLRVLFLLDFHSTSHGIIDIITSN
jgi:hypothetical protein